MLCAKAQNIIMNIQKAMNIQAGVSGHTREEWFQQLKEVAQLFIMAQVAATKLEQTVSTEKAQLQGSLLAALKERDAAISQSESARREIKMLRSRLEDVELAAKATEIQEDGDQMVHDDHASPQSYRVFRITWLTNMCCPAERSYPPMYELDQGQHQWPRQPQEADFRSGRGKQRCEGEGAGKYLNPSSDNLADQHVIASGTLSRPVSRIEGFPRSQLHRWIDTLPTASVRLSSTGLRTTPVPSGTGLRSSLSLPRFSAAYPASRRRSMVLPPTSSQTLRICLAAISRVRWQGSRWTGCAWTSLTPALTALSPRSPPLPIASIPESANPMLMVRWEVNTAPR